MKHIVCFHLYNDFSGSPSVLKVVLRGLLRKGYYIDLVTSKGGVLSTIEPRDGLRIYYYNYRFSENKFFTLINYMLVQMYTFVFAFRYLLKKDTIFYINTLLPFAPALAGRIMRKKVVYHYHENASVKGAVYTFLCRIMQMLANKIICVSQYQRTFLHRKDGVEIISNALSEELRDRLMQAGNEEKKSKTILMLSSLKLNKGICEFTELAGRLPKYEFCLVINEKQDDIEYFIKKYNLQINRNLRVYNKQIDVVSFYRKASVVVNLSNKEFIIESFGLTALEAMTAGLPVIVPTEGGIAEMVEDGINGYKINVQELTRVEACIDKILSDKNTYDMLSGNARHKAKEYDAAQMIEKVTAVLAK